MGDTTIRVSEELADELWKRKGRGKSYEELIWDLLEATDDSSAPQDVADERVTELDLNRDRSTGDDSDAAESDESAPEEPPHAGGDLSGVEFPRDREACERAVYAARDHLQEHGPASMREIVQAVMPQHPLGYDVPDLEPGDRFRGAWWRKVVKPGLEALEEIEKPPRGGSKWRYVGGDRDE